MPSRAFAERYPNLLATGGHPAVDMPPHVVEAAARAAERPAYAPTLGAPALREAIAAQLSGELGWAVDPERNVLVTVGGMQALYLAAQCFGARAVVHAPSFFFPQVVARGRRELHGDRRRRRARPTGTRSAAAIDGETTLAIVNTPVNPTGYVFRPHDLDAIAAALAGTDALLLSDEAYAGAPLRRARARLARLAPGAARAHARAAQLLEDARRWPRGASASRSGRRDAIETMARAFAWQALAVDGVAQAAAHAALTGPQDWIEARARRARRDAAARDRGRERDRASSAPSCPRRPRSSGPRSTATRTS